jgi:hypothetical protein
MEATTLAQWQGIYRSMVERGDEHPDREGFYG